MQECVGRERQRKLQEKTGAQGKGQQIESRHQSHPKDLRGGTDEKLGGQNKDSSQRNEKQTTQGGTTWGA